MNFRDILFKTDTLLLTSF